ncbi:MAG: Xaa-Pro peptidase family protein [Dethiosulfatibacter sp.]|nr:Xaa-Pro peptidase family protein [Dethiosulfatibacter sp.]
MNERYMGKLIDLLKKNDLDAILLIPSEELQFLAGFSPHLCERFQGLFIKKNGENFYFCNMLTKDELEGLLPDNRVFTWSDIEIFTDVLQPVLEKEGLIGKRIGVNSTARAFNILDIMQKIDVSFINGKSLLEDIRLIKTQDEIRDMKEAARRTDMVMEEIFEFIKPGMTEGEISDEVKKCFDKQGMVQEFAIVASGPNCALPHYSGNDRVIENKDVVLLDIGGKYNGLCSDMTRTVFVGGVTERETIAYNIVLEATLKGIETVKKGVMAKEIDSAARNVIIENGFGNYFTTRVGHGIGYSVHEAPYINGNSELLMEDGMAFSIEPGIYIKNQFGIRIEDIVLVENGKGVSLNKVTKDLIIL